MEDGEGTIKRSVHEAAEPHPESWGPTSLKARFCLVSGGLFVIAAVVIVLLVNHYMREQALREAEEKALLLLRRNLATHTYFTEQLKPNLFERFASLSTDDDFDPTWMSSTFAIRQIDAYFRSLSPEDYQYKECAVNARSPDNEADPFEAAFIGEMNSDRKLTQRSLVRILDSQPMLVALHRNEVMQEACLRCHGSPEAAPRDLIRRYGAERGFHRKVGEVVSAISIRVPLSAAYSAVTRATWRLSAFLLGVLVCLFAVQFRSARRMVFDPLAQIRDKALQISREGEHLGEEIALPSGREMRDLAAAFNSMSVAVRQNVDQLEERVRERTGGLLEANRRLTEQIGRRERAEAALLESERLHRGAIEAADAVPYYRDYGTDTYESLGEGIGDCRTKCRGWIAQAREATSWNCRSPLSFMLRKGNPDRTARTRVLPSRLPDTRSSCCPRREPYAEGRALARGALHPHLAAPSVHRIVRSG